MMRTAVPGATSTAVTDPGRLVGQHPQASTVASALAPATSAARTANPSMAEFANGGMSPLLATSSASTRPSASSRDRSSVPSGRHPPRIAARASS